MGKCRGAEARKKQTVRGAGEQTDRPGRQGGGQAGRQAGKQWGKRARNVRVSKGQEKEYVERQDGVWEGEG